MLRIRDHGGAQNLARNIIEFDAQRFHRGGGIVVPVHIGVGNNAFVNELMSHLVWFFFN